MKKLHIEWVRIIAIIMVVLNHSDLFYTFYTNTDNIITFSSSLLISSICKVNVPLFIMVTGALLIPKTESWKEIIKNRVNRIFIVLFVASGIIYLLECFLWNQEVFSIGNFVSLFLRKEIQISYWYLYEYIGILLILPIIGTMLRNMNDDTMKYCIGLAFLIKVGGGLVNFFIGYSIPFSCFIVSDSVFYLIIGYYLENRIVDAAYEKMSFRKIVIAEVGCIVATILMVLWGKSKQGGYQEYVLSILTPVLSMLLFIQIKKMCLRQKENKVTEIVSFLGSCTFGVYLIERIGQRVFLNFYLWLCGQTYGVFACAVYVVCILTFSVIVIGILKKNKFIRKYI